MRKNKYIALLAAFLITAVFFTPITAYANEDIKTAVDNPNESDEEYISADYSERIEVDEPPNESAIPDNSRPFTPDGQASVVDLAYEGDGKIFYTFKTPAGNVFYLIIDQQRGANNVYFLNAVTENDLLALAENSGTNGVNESAVPTTNPSTTNPNGNGGTSENPDDPKAEDDTPPKPKKSNMGMIIFLLIGMAAVGIVAYYIKVIRPKQQANIDDEDDDIPDEDDGEEMQFEDEPEEADGDEYEDSDDTDANDDKE